MNIFVTDHDPVIAAQNLCDKHIPKMIVESAQMLSTVHRMLDGTPERRPSKSGKTMQQYYTFGDERDELYYAAVHKYHPCTTWTAESKTNYEWHYEHFVAMAKEYQYRRDRVHATFNKLGTLLEKPPTNIPDKGLTEFAQAMNHYQPVRWKVMQCKLIGTITMPQNLLRNGNGVDLLQIGGRDIKDCRVRLNNIYII